MSAPLDAWFFVGPLRLQKSNDWWSDQEKSKKTVPRICGGSLHWAQEISQKRCLRHHALAFPTATGAALDKRTCQVGGTTAGWDLTLTKEPQKKLFNRRTQRKKTMNFSQQQEWFDQWKEKSPAKMKDSTNQKCWEFTFDQQKNRGSSPGKKWRIFPAWRLATFGILEGAQGDGPWSRNGGFHGDFMGYTAGWWFQPPKILG